MSDRDHMDYGGVGSGHAYGGQPDRKRRFVDMVSLTTADGLVTTLEVS